MRVDALKSFRADRQNSVTLQYGFEVVLARTGVSYCIPTNKSIAQVLEGHGVKVRLACDQGVCGTCIVRVLEGIPDHRDELLTEEEKAAGKKIAICVSRSRTPRLVLDL
jgi:vanillate O-demethylase ferredoxin subunit